MTLDPTDPRSVRVASSRGRGMVLGAGGRVGGYEIVELIAVGGMGEVYRAVDPKLERQVAIKVLRPDLHAGDPASILREAQAMAKLSHPNVVTVYEVGELEGRIYAVLEFVDGRTLRHWLAERPRPWREIVAMFAAAGRGLAAAHAVGIVHRDFKPDNVLVGSDGRARVTDFGLADHATELAPLSADDEVGSLDTMSFSMAGPGTPAYMSPEQHLRERIDARADQFAFCVALYEALFGARPFAGKSGAEIRESVLGRALVPPPRTSAIPSRIGAVLVRGLALEPSGRFPSMGALLAALEHDPSARRRHALLAAGAVGLAAVAIYGFARPRPSPCLDDPARLSGVWDPAVRAAVQQAFAGSGRSYADDTFARVAEKLDGYAARLTAVRTDACAATHVRHEQSDALLDLRMECLDRRLGELKALTVRFAKAPDPIVLDRAVSAADHLESVDRCAGEALGSARPLPTDPTARAQVTALRSRVQAVRALRLTGAPTAASTELGAILPEVQAQGYAPLELESQLELSAVQAALRRTEEQEATVRHVLALAARLHDDRQAARAWSALIELIGDSEGKPDEALALRAAGEAAVVRAGDGDDLRGELMSSVGRVFLIKGDFVAAEQALAQADAVLAGAHAELTVASNLNALGGLYLFTARYREAQTAFERARDIYVKELSPRHPYVAGVLINLAASLQRQGKLEEARQLDETAAAIFQPVVGEGVDLAMALNNLGEVLLDEGAYDLALPQFQRAVAIKEKARGLGDGLVASSLTGLGVTLARLGRFDEGAPAIQRSLAILEKVVGPKHPDLADALSGAATFAQLRGDCPSAIALAERAIAIVEGAYDRGHPNLVKPLLVVGECQLQLGKPREARVPIERALFARVSRGGAPADLPEAELAEARVRWQIAAGDPVALKLAEKARAELVSLGPGQAPRASEADRWLAGHQASRPAPSQTK